MTQEEKSLLLKDLSARLPYRVKVEIVSYGQEDEKPWVGTLYCTDLDCFISDIAYSSIKPYLHPMSSMTEEDRKEFFSLADNSSYLNMGSNDGEVFVWDNTPVPIIDWLNAHHFDYRGLIDEGLAIKAPEGMYV